MASRTDFFFRQRVTEQELDLAFELLEKADHNLAADIGVYGIISGAAPTAHLPVADLSIDLTAPAKAYDNLGQRIFFGTGQTVDCGVDHQGLSTTVADPANERWLGVFLKFDRLLSDPRTDGNSQQVFFRHDEHYQILVRQAPEGTIGTALKHPLKDDELLICDVRLRHGQTQIVEQDIDISRRQSFIFATGDAVEIVSGIWSIISPAANNVQAALDSVDELLADHFTGNTNKHAASHLTSTPYEFIEATNVQDQLQEIVSSLLSQTPTAGASRVGAETIIGSPNELSQGTVYSQLKALLAFLNTHANEESGAHAASSISVADSESNLTASDVETALAETLDAVASGHYRANETNAGQHKTIFQPAVESGMVLLFDASGTGSKFARLRIYADIQSVWFTLNAPWNGSAWARDDRQRYSGGFRFSRNDFELFHDSSGSETFDKWSRTWTLPMYRTEENSAFETKGDIQEIGRVTLGGTNTQSSPTQLYHCAAVTFRNRFYSTPSSITLTVMNQTNFEETPIVFSPDQNGFTAYYSKDHGANQTAWWSGTYTAIA